MGELADQQTMGSAAGEGAPFGPEANAARDRFAAVQEPPIGAATLVWRVLAAPRTFATLATLLAALLLAAAAVPQGIDADALLARYPYPVVTAIRAFGLHDVTASWPFVLLVMLLGLNALGLVLNVAMQQTAAGVRRGPWTDRAEAVLAAPLAVVAGSLAARVVAGRATAHRGLHRQAVVLVALGLVALLAGAATAALAGQEARLHLDVGAVADRRDLRYEVKRGDRFLPRMPAVALACDPPDPRDPARVQACQLGRAGSPTVPVALVPGHTTEVGGLRLTPRTQHAQPVVANRPLELLAALPGGAVGRLRVGAGAPAHVPATGETLTAFPSPDGPLVVVRRPGGRPSLLAPDIDAAWRGAAGGASLAWIPGQRLTVAVTTDSGRALVWGGAALVALGLLAMALVPALTVRLTGADPAHTHVVAWSPNRRGRARRVVAGLAPEGPA